MSEVKRYATWRNDNGEEGVEDLVDKDYLTATEVCQRLNDYSALRAERDALLDRFNKYKASRESHEQSFEIKMNAKLDALRAERDEAVEYIRSVVNASKGDVEGYWPSWIETEGESLLTRIKGEHMNTPLAPTMIEELHGKSDILLVKAVADTRYGRRWYAMVNGRMVYSSKFEMEVNEFMSAMQGALGLTKKG